MGFGIQGRRGVTGSGGGNSSTTDRTPGKRSMTEEYARLAKARKRKQSKSTGPNATMTVTLYKDGKVVDTWSGGSHVLPGSGRIEFEGTHADGAWTWTLDGAVWEPDATNKPRIRVGEQGGGQTVEEWARGRGDTVKIVVVESGKKGAEKGAGNAPKGTPDGGEGDGAEREHADGGRGDDTESRDGKENGDDRDVTPTIDAKPGERQPDGKGTPGNTTDEIDAQTASEVSELVQSLFGEDDAERVGGGVNLPGEGSPQGQAGGQDNGGRQIDREGKAGGTWDGSETSSGDYGNAGEGQDGGAFQGIGIWPTIKLSTNEAVLFDLGMVLIDALDFIIPSGWAKGFGKKLLKKQVEDQAKEYAEHWLREQLKDQGRKAAWDAMTKAEKKQLVEAVGQAYRAKRWEVIESQIAARKAEIKKAVQDGALDADTAKRELGELADGDTFAKSEFADARARAIQERMDEESRKRITIAVGVGEKPDGTRVVLIGTSEKNGYMRKGARDALEPNETVVGGVGEHAEVNVINYAKENDIKLTAVGAGRPHCDACVKAADDVKVINASPKKSHVKKKTTK